jgi:Fur family ferric uptake transcriptional regulator
LAVASAGFASACRGAAGAAGALAGGATRVLATGSSIRGFFDAQPASKAASMMESGAANADARMMRRNCIVIKGLNSLSNRAKTLYDKADNPDSTNNMPSNPSELKASGLKATLPRLKILDIFQNSPVRHLSAEDIYKILLTENMDVGLATVYRVLTQFEQAGLLHRNHFETGKAVFELNEGSHHDHLVCVDCGRVEEFFDEEIEKRQQLVARERGFEISDHALALYGHCTKDNCPYRNR